MRRNALAGGGGILSLWSQAMCAKASGSGQGHHVAFASASTRPTPPSSGGLATGPNACTGGLAAREASCSRSRLQGRRRSGARGVTSGGGADEGAGGGGRPGRGSQLIFVGTGSSTAVPGAFQLLHPELNTRQSTIAQLSVATPPEVNKNYRGNTSVLVRVVREPKRTADADNGSPDSDTDTDSPDHQKQGARTSNNGGGGQEGVVGRQPSKRVYHVQIDTGKTWREGVIRWFPRHGVPGIDGIVLTHDHADAMLGLDDVRSIQDPAMRVPTPVHVSQKTDRSVRRVFPYLVGREDDNGKGGRFVAALKFNVFQDFQPFEVGGLEVTPFPVLHGEDYVSHGFLFGPEGNKICYISDVSRVPPESLEFLQRQGQLQLLVCDALMRSRKHPTHFSVEDSVALARDLRARRTLLVGLGSDIEYHATTALLESQEESEDGAPHVRLAYDGLAVDVDL